MSWWKQIWFAFWCAGVVGCGDTAADSKEISSPKSIEQTYLVDVRGSYLRQALDRPERPTVIALGDIEASAGVTLRLGRQGSFKKTLLGSMTDDGMAAVFSASDKLRNPRNRRRVIDAIDAGVDVYTPRTLLLRKKTDVYEDFEITDSVDVVVPSGATHLFITAIDNYFSDNMSLDFALSVQVITDGNLCEGVDCDDDNECTDDACDPLSGACEYAPVVDVTACDFAGLPGACGGGVCQDAMLCEGIDCDDGNECTDDACDPLNGQCNHTAVADGTDCDAGGTAGICMSGVCEVSDLCEGSDCDDTNECTADLCDPQDGQCDFNPVANDTPCNFGGLPGLCQGGVCQDAALCQGIDCDDVNQCTADACDPQDGLCDNTPVADDTPCNFGGFPGRCISGVCEDAALCQGVACDDTNDCTADLCDPQDGQCDFNPVANDTPCNFGGLPGLCQGGVCRDAALCQGIDCDDVNQCTADACDPQDGLCDNTPVADDTPCNFGGFPGRCISGVCEDAALCQGVACDDTNDCTADLCDPQDGQCDFIPEPAGTSCNAGDGPASGTCDGAGRCNPVPACGDGTVDPDELCDDGNNANGDGCNASCNWEPISATFIVCCENIPLVGERNIVVNATALPMTTVVAGQIATVAIDGIIDTSAIGLNIDADLIAPSTFMLSGVSGSSSSESFNIPTEQPFNPVTNPQLDLGMHQMSVDIDQGAAQACINVTDTLVTARILGSPNTLPCRQGTCSGTPNDPVCIDVSP